MSNRRAPDACVVATDRNGHVLERHDLYVRYINLQERIAELKRELRAKYVRDYYVFTNVYC